jgi:tetratricopeptide (TPR) repeat protein
MNDQDNPALISCPDCGGKVSKLAATCPHCGRPDFLFGMTAQFYMFQGNVHVEQGQYDKAITDFTEVIRIDPDYADAYVNRGLVRVFQNTG